MKSSVKNPSTILGLILLAGLPSIAFASDSPAPGTPAKSLSTSDWSSIRAAYEAGRHAVHRKENGTLTARNPGQQWRTEFDGKGFTVTPDHGQWTWGLELIGYGERTLDSTPSSITHDGGNISIRRDENLTEWFINDTRGLEQGWTIHSRSVEGVSPSSANLTLTLDIRGNLQPRFSPDSTSVSFQKESGATALTYGGLKAWDADGKSLAVRFEDAAGNAIRIAVDDQNARYPITIDPIAQQAYLKASNTDSGDYFGYSVAVSGDTVVVGAVGEDSSTAGVNSTPNNSAADAGAAYVFVRSGGTWSQQAYLKASNPGQSDSFGHSVAVSGNTVIVGAKGENSSTTGVHSTPNNNAAAAGAVYVFVRNGGIWSQQAYLKASNTGANDEFGGSVAVSGDTVIVGARFENSSTTGVNSTPNNSAGGAGAAYVFVRNSGTWTQQAYLKASNAQFLDFFGCSVGVSGDTVVVGAEGEDSSTGGVNSTPNESASYSGAAYVFVRNGVTWSQEAYLKASNPEAGNYFGYSVAVSGDTVVIGAPYNYGVTPDFAGYSGSAYVFVRNSDTWSQQAYLRASNFGADDVFGTAVAVSGDTIAIGANQEDSSTSGVNSTPDENASRSGAAYVFGRSGGIWSQIAYLKASNTGAGDEFGSSVAVSADTVVVGAPSEDSSTSGVNSTPDESAGNSGATYLFDLPTGSVAPEIHIQQAESDIAIGAVITFGSRVVGTTSDLPFTIFNTGVLDLTLTGIPTVALTGSSDFTVTVQPAMLISGPNGSSNFTVRFTPTGSGLKNASLSIPNNDADENPFVINLIGTATTASALFNSTIAVSSGLTGDDALPSAIPFNDGVENLLKYAFNMSLSGPDARSLTPGTGTAGLPSVGLTGSGVSTMLRVEFLRRKGSGLIYTPKRSSNLAPGSFVEMTGTPVVTSIDANWERVVVEESANPANLPKSFAVVEVMLP